MSGESPTRFGRASLASIAPYTPGEQPRGGGVIKLNTNENPYPASPKVFEALANLNADALRKYPDPLSVELRTVCAERYGLPGPEWVMVGNGMDELLAMAIRGFVDPGGLVVSVNPTYTLYGTLAALHGARFETVALDGDYQLPAAGLPDEAALAFVPRPNAPSGVAAPKAAMASLCESFDGVVAIDEAYVDFADDDCMDFPARFDNVLVMRTFSKSFSLAGLRIGTVSAHPDLIHEFLRTKDSYNLNIASQAAAIAAMRDYGYMQAQAAKVCATRSRLIAALRDRGFLVPDSQTNFVLAVCSEEGSAPSLLRGLRDRNILVRYFDAPGLENALRISIGTDEEIDALISGLDALLNR